MIIKNIRHHIRLGYQLFKLAWRNDVLVEKSVTVKYVDTIRFGKKCTLQSGVYLYGSRRGKEVVFGDYVVVGSLCMLLGEGGLNVGDCTHFGPSVVVTTQYGDSTSEQCTEDAILKYSPIKIGKGCWIGAGSIIMPGAVLGDRCIVAPNSVVYGVWKDNVKLAGNPARNKD